MNKNLTIKIILGIAVFAIVGVVGFLTLIKNQRTPAANSSDILTVLSPNGDGKLYLNFHVSIKWQYSSGVLDKIKSGDITSISIDINESGGTHNGKITIVEPLSTYYSWQVGALDCTETDGCKLLPAGESSDRIIPGKQYRIRVCAGTQKKPRIICDESDTPFDIVSPPPSLNLIFPNGGEFLHKGEIVKIKWATSDAIPMIMGGVDIILIPYHSSPSAYPATKYLISAGVPGEGRSGSGSYSWHVGEYIGLDGSSTFIDNGSYLIKICRSGLSNCDISDSQFNIDTP